MYFLAQTTKFQDRRDSSARSTLLDINHYGYREFLLNPNRISNLLDRSTLQLGLSSFLFSDNHRDRRENLSYIECNLAPATIEAAHNTAFFSKFITLPICPKNDPTKTPVDTIIDVEDLAYADRYNPDPDNFVWVIYNKKAFKRVEVLCSLSLEQLEDIAETGSTTSTTTSTTEQR